MGRTQKRLTLCKGEAVTPVAACPPPETNAPVDAAQPMPATAAVPVPMSGVPSAVPETADRVPSLPEPMPEPIPLSAWHLCGDAVIGLAHRRKGLPCQDAVAFRNSPRPILALSDGAGSAAISERGATALVVGITRFLVSLEDALASWLDDIEASVEAEAGCWAGRLLRHARGLLDDLALAERRSVRDLRATLLLAIVGTRRTFWWQVGDGAIVVRHADGLRALGNPVKAKGEFANQTCFVDVADIADVQFGLLTSEQASGLALMSDGGAEKLVSHDGGRVSTRIGEWQDAVVRGCFSAAEIALAYHEPRMCERATPDDRSIVLAAREISPEKTTPVLAEC